MRPTRIDPAVLMFDDNGTPYSPEFRDVYHSSDSGPDQARHVFLSGSNLPENWRGRSSFTVVETGFGLGMNFLSTWQAWRDDPRRPDRLNYVSVEKHPLTRADLTRVWRCYPGFTALASSLIASWPKLTPGTHRIHFEAESVTLTLVFADGREALAGMRFGADAFFLDGFSPDRNGDLWSVQVMKLLARLARPGATLATYTAAGKVRDALTTAGFEVSRRAGFGRKREMVVARFAPRWVPRRSAPSMPVWPRRSATIIGAGLAGGAIAGRLAARGWDIHVLEQGATVASGTSRLHAAAYHPHVSRDDCPLTRFTRAAFLYSLMNWDRLEPDDEPAWCRCGVFQAARDEVQERRFEHAISHLLWPAELARFVDRDAASELCGLGVTAGGLWFSLGGWVRPGILIRRQIAHRGIRLSTGVCVTAIRRQGEDWCAIDAGGMIVSRSPVMILANAAGASSLARFNLMSRQVAGRLLYVPSTAFRGLNAVITGKAQILPPVGLHAVVGAPPPVGTPLMSGSNTGDWGRLSRILAAAPAGFGAGQIATYESNRQVAVDRMPIIGAVPDQTARTDMQRNRRDDRGAIVPRLPGLYAAVAYASRGVTWASLGAELIASMVEGDPLPVESDLADAVDPVRFA